MSHEHAEKIEQIVSDVLEQLAFVFADPAEADELTEEPAQLIAASMYISGASSGRLVVVSGVEVCKELAGNLMGMEPDEVDGQQAGYALMELANVLCGRLLTDIVGVEPVFDLAPPVILDESVAAWNELMHDSQSVGFLADDCPILVRLQLDDAIPEAA